MVKTLEVDAPETGLIEFSLHIPELSGKRVTITLEETGGGDADRRWQARMAALELAHAWRESHPEKLRSKEEIDASVRWGRERSTLD